MEKTKISKAKGRFVNLALMLFVITLFESVCLVSLLVKSEVQYRLNILISYGVFIAVQYGYFLGTRMILKRKGFEVELIAFLLTSIGLSITLSVYPEKAIKQLVAILIGIGGFIFLQWLLRDINRVMALRIPAAIVALVALFGTLILAKATNGAKNWLYIGGLSIQPSEIVKAIFIFVGSATLEKLQSNKSLTKFIIFSFLCVGSLFLMYDFGTALIFFFTFIVISFMRSGDIRTLILVCAAAFMGGILVLVFKPYVARRFMSFGHAWENFDTSGFQQTRNMIYSASGGLFGVGLGNGKLRNVFASTEDLVFGMVCEEFGMITAGAILLCYVALLVYSIRHSKYARSTFYAISAISASSLMLFQASLNVFGVNDIIPWTGVTLPFISRGGSSIMSCWFLLAFIKAVDRGTYRYGGVRQ